MFLCETFYSVIPKEKKNILFWEFLSGLYEHKILV